MFRRSEVAVAVSGSFWLLVGWFCLCNGWQLTAMILFAALLHEAGHLLLLRLLGGHLFAVRLSALGVEMETDSSRLSYGRELLVLLAGPGANFLAALITAALLGQSGTLFVGINLVLCVFNLMPIVPLDGGHLLFLTVCWAAGPAVGAWAARCVGSACAAALASFFCWLMLRSGGSLWLFPVLGGLICGIWYLWRPKETYFLK